MVGVEGFELEPLCGRLSPQAKSRADARDLLFHGRGGGIRTPDPLLPKQMRYQTALRPDVCFDCSIEADAMRMGGVGQICREMMADLPRNDPDAGGLPRVEGLRGTRRANSIRVTIERGNRGVAQSGSASALGAEGRGFESLRPDHGKEVPRIRSGFRLRTQTPA